jgi:hypothetical protein
LWLRVTKLFSDLTRGAFAGDLHCIAGRLAGIARRSCYPPIATPLDIPRRIDGREVWPSETKSTPLLLHFSPLVAVTAQLSSCSAFEFLLRLRPQPHRWMLVTLRTSANAHIKSSRIAGHPTKHPVDYSTCHGLTASDVAAC